MKVVITDYSFPDLAIEEEILQSAGHEIIAWKERRTAFELASLVADADAVITQFAPVNADVIAAMQRARVIVRYGVGFDNVDLEASRAKGIPVCNVPGFCIDEVADHTLAFILATTRQVVTNNNSLKAGKWGLATRLDQMQPLKEVTVGVVGFGRIGREVVARLRPFRCRILVHDPIANAADVDQAGAALVTMPDLLSQSGVITLHCPSNPENRNILNADSLGMTRRGVIIVNLGRGELIEPNALTAALQSGHVGAAALDVFNPEPIPADHPILKMDNVIVASHIASASVAAVRTLRETAANLALKALNGERLPDIVNGVRQ